MTTFRREPPKWGKIAISDQYLVLGSMTGGASNVVNNYFRTWNKKQQYLLLFYLSLQHQASDSLFIAADGHVETQHISESLIHVT